MNDTMTEKKLRSLGKTDLLRIMHMQEDEIERLSAKNSELEGRLKDRRIMLEKAGSIAEASIAISGVLQAAQESANLYIESLRVMESELTQRENDVNRRAEEIIRNAEQRAAACEALEKQTSEALWNDFKERVDKFIEAHAELDEIIYGNPIFARPGSKPGGAAAEGAEA
jgi:cell division septum initiation protein DivIVA